MLRYFKLISLDDVLCVAVLAYAIFFGYIMYSQAGDWVFSLFIVISVFIATAVYRYSKRAGGK